MSAACNFVESARESRHFSKKFRHFLSKFPIFSSMSLFWILNFTFLVALRILETVYKRNKAKLGWNFGQFENWLRCARHDSWREELKTSRRVWRDLLWGMRVAYSMTAPANERWKAKAWGTCVILQTEPKIDHLTVRGSKLRSCFKCEFPIMSKWSDCAAVCHYISIIMQ